MLAKQASYKIAAIRPADLTLQWVYPTKQPSPCQIILHRELRKFAKRCKIFGLVLEKNMSEKIVIRGAREHNLKNVDLDIPKNRLVVIKGISGSGKSSLAFDTLYA